MVELLLSENGQNDEAIEQDRAAIDLKEDYATPHYALGNVLFALAYNLDNFLRHLVPPKPIQSWTLTTLREKLVKIGAKVVRHSNNVVFQLAEAKQDDTLLLNNCQD